MDSSSSFDSLATGIRNIDQPRKRESISHIDSNFYEAAAEGKIDHFSSYLEPLDLLLTPHKNTILHIYITARTKGAKSVKFVNEILLKCPSLLVKPNIGGEIPLHIAARHGHDDIVKVLIDHANAQHSEDIEKGTETAREMLRMKNIDGETALHEAARHNHLEVVRILTSEDPDFMYLENEVGESPLYLAAERGYHQILFVILETCNSPSYYGPNGRTVLHEAVIRNDPDMTEKILQRNDNLTLEVDQQGWTPLHHASYFGHLEILKQLLKSNKFAAYVRDEDGRIPLHIAAIRGNTHIELVKTTILYCPDCCELVDQRGRNVFHFAVKSSSEALVDFLACIPSLANLINQKDAEGNTPLHLLGMHCVDSSPLIRHPVVDKNAVNKRNLTAMDIVLTNSDEYVSGLKGFTISRMKEAGYERSKRNSIAVKGKLEETLSIPDLQKVKDAHLIVAALIATVTFAAVFTLPGGYQNDNNDPEQGTAILTRKASFKAFLITDTLAFLLSISVVLIHLLLAMERNKRKFYNLFILAFILTIIAMTLMVMAFATGTYAVLPQSGLGVVTIVITTCFSILSYYILKLFYSR